MDNRALIQKSLGILTRSQNVRAMAAYVGVWLWWVGLVHDSRYAEPDSEITGIF